VPLVHTPLTCLRPIHLAHTCGFACVPSVVNVTDITTTTVRRRRGLQTTSTTATIQLLPYGA
jgi:hypothetical protein